jgi:hypothetical protein
VGLRVASRRYYNVVFKAVVEDLGLRLFEQWRRSRVRRPLAPGAPPAAAADGHGHHLHAAPPRPEPKALVAAARGLTWLLKLDVVLFGGVRTGPFFGLLVPRERA